MGCRRVALEFNRENDEDRRNATISKSTAHRVMKTLGLYEKPPKREHEHLLRPPEPFKSFAMDFKEKVVAGGGRMHIFDMIDEFDNAIVVLDAHRYADASSVITSLDRFVRLLKRSDDVTIRSDNGREFQNEILKMFCMKNGITLDFVMKGCPWKNAFVERNIRTVTEECLNIHWLGGVADTQKVLTDYKHRFNRRENMGLGYKTPLQKLGDFYSARRSNI